MAANNSLGQISPIEKSVKHKSNSSQHRVPQSAPKQEIAFVNLTDSSGPIQDAEDRKLVRRHVMRGYQRQKQAKEAQQIETIQQQRHEELKETWTTILPIFHLETRDPEETYLSIFSDIQSNQYGVNTGRVVEQEILGEWVPVTDTANAEAQEVAETMMDTSSNFEIQNYDLEDSNWDSNINLLSESPEYSQSLELVPEEVECPLISQSLTLTLSFNALNSGMLDPFNAMPGLENARAQALMYHYNKVLVNTLIPVNPKDKWFNYAISDEALFHATMLHSAGHNAMLAGNFDLADPFQLKLEAIRSVNRRLNDPLRSTSDLTIGAVACLVLFENQAGNLEVSNIHMKGLRRMINLRGGLLKLGLSGVLLRKVLWADICNAMLSHSEPQYNLPQYGERDTVTPTGLIELDISSRLQTDPSEASERCKCDMHLKDIIDDLRKLSDKPPINALDGAITDHLYLVERRLVLLLNKTLNYDHSPTCHTVSGPSFIASLAYIYTFLRDFPIQAPLLTVFVDRLSNSMFEVEPLLKWERSGYPLLQWILTMGAIAASGRKDREHFISKLEAVTYVLGVWTFVSFVDELRRIVWGSRGEEALKKVWHEVLELRQSRMEDFGNGNGFSAAEAFL